tara:strand:- start:290 stop:850 length:561 start_codon:yes stop_codon:yes gene_type:complete
MCGVPEAQLALSVFSTVAKFQNDKEVYERDTKANEKSMQNADWSYLNDISKIDTESSRAVSAKSLAEFKAKQELAKKHSIAKNAGFGDSFKVMQDISGKHDLGFSEIAFDFEADMLSLQNSENDAYASLHRNYANIRPTQPPSLIGSVIELGSHTLNYAGSDNKWINRRKTKNNWSHVTHDEGDGQ